MNEWPEKKIIVNDVFFPVCFFFFIISCDDKIDNNFDRSFLLSFVLIFDLIYLDNYIIIIIHTHKHKPTIHKDFTQFFFLRPDKKKSRFIEMNDHIWWWRWSWMFFFLVLCSICYISIFGRRFWKHESNMIQKKNWTRKIVINNNSFTSWFDWWIYGLLLPKHNLEPFFFSNRKLFPPPPSKKKKSVKLNLLHFCSHHINQRKQIKNHF